MGGSLEQGGLRGRAPAGLRLIETMLWQPDLGVALLQGHLARLSRGCAVLDIACDMVQVKRLLGTVTAPEPLRLRLTVGVDGVPDLTRTALPAAKAPWRVGLAGARVIADDPFRQIKSTERALYDTTRATLPEGWDEAIFLNERDELVEGTITNLFLLREGVLLTPPVTSGALPGVLRAELLRTGRAREAVVRLADLAEGGLFLGNALRGLMAAEMI